MKDLTDIYHWVEIAEWGDQMVLEASEKTPRELHVRLVWKSDDGYQKQVIAGPYPIEKPDQLHI